MRADSSANFDTQNIHCRDPLTLMNSDDLFHFSPLAELHENTISPICQPFRRDNLSSGKSLHSSPPKLDIESESLSDGEVSNHGTDATHLSTTNSSSLRKRQVRTGAISFLLHATAQRLISSWRLPEVIVKYRSCGRISPTRSSITMQLPCNLTVSC